jgi:hypothetical protein
MLPGGWAKPKKFEIMRRLTAVMKYSSDAVTFAGYGEPYHGMEPTAGKICGLSKDEALAINSSLAPWSRKEKELATLKKLNWARFRNLTAPSSSPKMI